MLNLASLYFTRKGCDLLASLEKCNLPFTWIKTMKQVAFLVISSIPSLKNIAQTSSHFFRAHQLISPIFVYLP